MGTWSVASGCLGVTGQLNLQDIGSGPSCPSVSVTGSLQVTGTWTASPGPTYTYTDNTTTQGTEQFPLAASCLLVSGTQVGCSGWASLLGSALGYTALDCESASGGGCNCTGTVSQSGGIGLVSPSASNNGNYATSGNTMTIDGNGQYQYCATASGLTLTPQSTSPTLTGSIVLQKSSAASGGAGGGQAGAGGSHGGGASGAGGASGHTGGSSTAAGGNAGGSPGSGGADGGAAGASGAMGPCDIYGAANTPCVAAHSTVRALYAAYSGKLYQVRRSDNTTQDILTLAPGGIADSGPQDTFCAGSTCVITVVYDQSGKGNDLWYQGSTEVPASTSSSPANATNESLTVGGHKVYSLFIKPGNCYWHDGSKTGMATGAQPEGIYMVTSGTHSNGGCCFDYGNSETDRTGDGPAAMDAINFSSTAAWGTGAGSGPWVMANLEAGLFSEGSPQYGKNQSDPTQTSAYVTAVLRNNGTTEFVLRGGDATSGSLSTYYQGSLPANGWSPMKKQGALILGCGGDCCKPNGGANQSDGTFYEGAIVFGYPTDATEDAVQVTVVAAGYGK